MKATTAGPRPSQAAAKARRNRIQIQMARDWAFVPRGQETPVSLSWMDWMIGTTSFDQPEHAET